MIYRCTYDDKEAASDKSPIFTECRSRGHEIMAFLDDNDKIQDAAETKPIITPSEAESLPTALSRMNDVIRSSFPSIIFAVTVCLAIKAQMSIRGVTQVFTLILMGNPSSYKSTVLEILSALPECYVSDSFTPKSFVSHSANSSKKDLEKVDLLPRIRHKTLVTPELAPLFSGNPDQLVEYFGMLTRILDGRGFQSDSGVHGSRGYQGDYSFTWIGAVVDIPHRVWKLLGNLGPKIYFLRLPSDQKSGNEKINEIKQILKGQSYATKLESCKEAIKEYWQLLQTSVTNHKICWDSEKDDEATLEKIIQMAMILAKLRASVPTWHTAESDSGGASYNFETPIEENPSRASSALYNLARGHAVLNGRNHITPDDLKVVVPVALSSAARERVELLRLLIEHDGKLNTDEYMEASGVSRATARKEMERLVKIGLAQRTEVEGETKPIMAVKLKPEFDWFLSDEFLIYWHEFKSTLNPRFSKLSQENLEKNGMSGGHEAVMPKTATLDIHLEAQN
jgi:hypothetical protein